MMRKYTVIELSRMRKSLREIIFYENRASDQYEIYDEAEDQLRTHMLNETDPVELEAEEDRLFNRYWDERAKEKRSEPEPDTSDIPEVSAEFFRTAKITVPKPVSDPQQPFGPSVKERNKSMLLAASITIGVGIIMVVIIKVFGIK